MEAGNKVGVPKGKGRIMHNRTAIDVDCSELVPACGFNCYKCFAEVRHVLAKIDGISRTHIEQQGGERRLLVEHDSTVVVPGQLANALERTADGS